MTQIWTADIRVGDRVAKDIPCYRLPVYVLWWQWYYRSMFKEIAGGDKAWEKLKKDRITGLPEIKIKFKKYLSETSKSGYEYGFTPEMEEIP